MKQTIWFDKLTQNQIDNLDIGDWIEIFGELNTYKQLDLVRKGLIAILKYKTIAAKAILKCGDCSVANRLEFVQEILRDTINERDEFQNNFIDICSKRIAGIEEKLQHSQEMLTNTINDLALPSTIGVRLNERPSVYVGLLTTDGIELNGSGYARVPTFSSDWSIATHGSIHNITTLRFASATEEWKASTHFALFDKLSEGNMLAYGPMVYTQIIRKSNTAYFQAGDLNIGC